MCLSYCRDDGAGYFSKFWQYSLFTAEILKIKVGIYVIRHKRI